MILAGYCSFDPAADSAASQRHVAAMLTAQLVLADGAAIPSTMKAVPGVAVGIADRRPLPAALGRDDGPATVVLADARLDNRDELIAALGRDDGPVIDDHTLLADAYARWGPALVDHVAGDFAIAIWDARAGALQLMRDPTGQRPLHYNRTADGVAFASLPQGLLALPGMTRTIDRRRLAQFVADRPASGPETFFAEVSRVRPGHVVRLTAAGVREHSYWRMPAETLRYARDEDYVDGFRERLDRATAVRLPAAGDAVASHLSAGMDSGAVTATAARLLADRDTRLLAITAAPRAGFDGPLPFGRIGDESALAAAVAARFPNVDHLVLRSTGASPLAVLPADLRLFGQPAGLPCNNLWWGAANAAAHARGVRVVLTGEVGNLTISAGGVAVLADFVRRGRMLRWLTEARALERGEPRWRGLLAASFGPWLPRRLLRALGRLSGSGAPARADDLLADAARDLLHAAPPPLGAAWGERERDARWANLSAGDPGNFRKAAWLRWDIEERDPTADRRLIEFCFALPPEQLLGHGQTRRLARTALADRLPPATLNGPRGYQFADWYEAIDRSALADFAAALADDADAAATIDLARVRERIREWPPGDWASGRTIGRYRIGLLRALSAGAFALNAKR